MLIHVWAQYMAQGIYNHKLIRTNIQTKNVNFIKIHKIVVIINTKPSDMFQTNTGIPQGGASSTTLLYINASINDITKSNNTVVSVFADDSATIASSKRSELAN